MTNNMGGAGSLQGLPMGYQAASPGGNNQAAYIQEGDGGLADMGLNGGLVATSLAPVATAKLLPWGMPPQQQQQVVASNGMVFTSQQMQQPMQQPQQQWGGGVTNATTMGSPVYTTAAQLGMSMSKMMAPVIKQPQQQPLVIGGGMYQT